jgi:hypothetical protein
MKAIKITALTCLVVLFTTTLFAQRGRGYNRYSYKHNYHDRSYFSVNVGPRFNYRPYYRPAPDYRFNRVYRPVYSSSRAYSHFGPVFGFRLNVLPFGYSRIYVGGNPYYYSDGVYYRNYDNNSYEVVAPPLNATVRKLPSNATVTVIDGQKYYQVGGTFYQEEFSDNNKLTYRVVGTDGVIDTGGNGNADQAQQMTDVNRPIPTMGSRYDELPSDSRVQIINQQKYFASPGGVYYKK